MRFWFSGTIGTRIPLVVSCVLPVICGAIGAQAAEGREPASATAWSGGIGANIRSGSKIVHQRADGSIVIAGHGNLEGVQGVGLVAVTEDGEALWQRIYGAGMHLNQPLGLGSLPDGSIQLFGYLYDPAIRGGQVPWLARLADDGAIAWERRYDGDGLYLPAAFDSTAEGDSVAVGRAGRNSVWAMKLDQSGGVVWTRRMTRSGVGLKVTGVRMTDDGGVVVTGSMDRDAWVAKLDAYGVPLWSVRAGTEKGSESAVGAVETGGGGVLSVALTSSGEADSVLWLIRLDSDGRVLWQSTLGGAARDYPRTVAPDQRGGAWIAGVHTDGETAEGDGVPWVVRVGSDGTVAVDARIPEPDIIRGFAEKTAGIGATHDDGVVFAARTMGINHAVGVFKLDGRGRGGSEYPELVSADSVYRGVEIPVRSAPVETGRIEAAVGEVASTTLEIPFEGRRQWTVMSAAGRPVGPEPVAKPLPATIEKAEVTTVLGPELLLEGDFDKLDRWAESLVESKQRDAYGWLKILAFYQDLELRRSPLVDYGMVESTGLMEQWHRERPDSIAARVALATAYRNLAWEHRGSGLGREVTHEGVLEKERYLEKAWEVLTEVYDERPKDPQYWSVLLGMTHLWGRTTPHTPEVLAEALEIAPDYLSIYLNEAHFRVPQWGGSRGEAERFAASSTDAEINPFGEELYARIAVSLARESERKKVFGEHGFDWPRVRGGLELINQRYPERLNFHWAAYMAVLAGDRQAANAFLAEDEGGYGEDVRKIWKNEANFLSQLRWATWPSGGEWAAGDASDWPDLAVVITEGDGATGSAAERLGFLVSRDGGKPPVFVTAIGPSSARYPGVDATLELLGRGDRIGSWVITPRVQGGARFTGLEELGLEDPKDLVTRSVVLAAVPTASTGLGIPLLNAAPMEGTARSMSIVGCAGDAPGCAQIVVKGVPIGGGSGTFSLAVDEAVFDTIRLGSPVLDEMGNAIGVVIEPWFDGSSPDGQMAHQLHGLALAGLVPRVTDTVEPRVESSSVAGRSAVEEAALKLMGDGRWSELEQLALWVENLRADNGDWVADGVFNAFQRRTIDPHNQPGPDAFDEVGAAIDDWMAASPSAPIAVVAGVTHRLGKPPRPPENVLWSHDDAAAAWEHQCEILGLVLDEAADVFPDDVYVRVAGVRWASKCGEKEDVAAALGYLGEAAPDLTPVYAGAIRSLAGRQRWSAEDAASFIDEVAENLGPEVQATLYGVTMINGALRREPDPTLDGRRVADEYGNWIDRYPGGSFAEARLLSLLCRLGETERAAARLEIRHCSEVRMSGSTWSKEICRQCFGGDRIPKPGEAADSQPGE